MLISRTADQQELAQITGALLAKRADSAASRRALDTPVGYDVSLWTTMCEQIGVAALPIADEYAGAGATLAESAVVLESLTNALVPHPLLGTTLAATALTLWGTEEAKVKWLPLIAAGGVATIAWPGCAGGLALNAGSAEHVFTIDDGLLAHVAAAELDLTPTMDQFLRLGTLRGATASVGGAVDPAVLTAIARALVSAMQVGLAQRGLDMTVAYAKDRVQFGRPIGSFQAIKHRLADMLVQVEAARSASLGAVAAAVEFVADPASDDARALLLKRARVASAYCSEASAHVTGETVQLHGGIAITWEHDAHLIFKAGHALGQLLGQAHEVRAELAR